MTRTCLARKAVRNGLLATRPSLLDSCWAESPTALVRGALAGWLARGSASTAETDSLEPALPEAR